MIPCTTRAIRHQIGSPVQINNQTFIRTEKGEFGCAIFGPYDLYQPGIYSATFNVMPECTHIKAELCGWADVATGLGTHILEKTNLFSHRLLQQSGQVTLQFQLSQPTELEFRVFSTGRARLLVSTELVARPTATMGYCPVFPLGTELTNEFARRHFPQLRSIYENGGQFQLLPKGLIAICSGISCYLHSPDEFQLLNEIFFGNEYHCFFDEDILAIDIGMNAGLASLYLASQPRVMEVHAFEPFREPYKRALKNFSLNPDLSTKILPMRVGLSDRNDKLQVLSSSCSTIGTSVRGTLEGDPEIIEIRDAAPVFRKLIGRARSKGWQVVAKIDCEGSEFDIIEALTTHGLLGGIRALMIEWHKWWSPDKSQMDLINRLAAANFVIFDRTIPANPYAGMLYAVRSAEVRQDTGKERRPWWRHIMDSG